MPSPLNVPITPPRVAFIDDRTGNVSREWYMFFLSLFQLAGGSSVSLADLQKGPPPVTIDQINSFVDKALANINPSQDAALAQIAELQKQLNDVLQQPIAFEDQIVELQKQVEGLQLAPPPREFKRSRYGSFLDTTTQTAGTINTATPLTFNTTDLSQGVYIGTPSSRIYVDTEAIYDFQTSLQLDSSVSTDEHFYLWIAINGVDVPNSASTVRLKGNNSESILALNFFLNLKSGDYVEFYFSVTNLGVAVQYVAATPPVPAIPSVILTVSNNIQGVQ